MARSACRDCGDLLTEDTRVMKSVSKKGKQYYLNRCKPCLVESDVLLRTLKTQHPGRKAGTPCACCKRVDRLYCDLDHATKLFPGWVCRQCNAGMGLLGDSEEGLKQALAYLERVRTNSRSRSPSESKNDDQHLAESVEVASSRRDNIQQGPENMRAEQ